jgi:hypothetical protein
LWFQRAKKRELLEGDALTSYFMSRVSGEKIKIKLFLCNKKVV